jgi:hypothetical protein
MLSERWLKHVRQCRHPILVTFAGMNRDLIALKIHVFDA